MSSPSPCAYVTGTGIHTCMGDAVAANVAGLRRPPQELDWLPRRLFEEDVRLPYRMLAGMPMESRSEDQARDRLKNVLFGVVGRALDEAGLTAEQRRRVLLLIGSSSFDVAISEQLYRKEVETDGENALPLRLSRMGIISLYIREHFGMSGDDFSFNTACTSSANAALYAQRLLATGVAEHALVVGVELFNEISLQGFHGLSLMSGEPMRPFDDTRNGLNLGEACGAVVLGRKPRKPKSFYLRGGASVFDKHSISAANPDGSSIYDVMEKALRDAGCDPSQIEMIKTHGTASLLNDEAEAAGMKKLFPRTPALCALKPFVGHTLGACGVVEMVLLSRAAELGFLPANPGVSVTGSLGVSLLQSPSAYHGGDLMLNYFGFGGNNCSLVLSRDHGGHG